MARGLNSRSSAENRRLILAAARRLLKTRGLASPVQTLTLRDAYIEAGVPQQSAYRLYQGREIPPQEAFRLEVLTELLSDDPLADSDNTRDEVVRHLTSSLEVISTGTPYEMGVVFREMMRLSTSGWVDAAQLSDSYPLLLTTAVAAKHSSNESELAAVLEASTRPVETDLHNAVIEMFGIRYRDGHDASRVLAIWASMLTGNHIATALNPELSVIYRNTGPDGRPQPWNIVGILCEALTIRVMEVNPEAERAMSFEPLTDSRWVDAPIDPDRSDPTGSGEGPDLADEQHP